MPQKEASARIKINKLLESGGWRFFDDDAGGPANVSLEPNVKITQQQVDAMGNDFQTASHGFIDFLLLDDKGFAWVFLEAKAESKNPLIGKEQARKYAKSQNCRFVILSNDGFNYHEPDLPVDPELPRNAKGWIRDRMPGGYGETTDQPAFAAHFDLAVAYQRSRSFRKLCSEWDRNVVNGLPVAGQ